MTTPRVSIVLPTLNGEADLHSLLPALKSQELPPEWNGFELCAVDSSSDDNTRAMLVEFGALVRTIERSDFGHGRTRNLAAGDARGEFIVFLSQDAVPADAHFLRHLIEAFDDDPRVAGAYGRVLPNPDDDPLTQRTVLNLHEASPEPRDFTLDQWGSLKEVPPGVRDVVLRFNNVASAIRASVFREHTFPEVPFGEDFGWAARVLEAGHAIRSVPAAVVRHAHRYGPLEAFQRYRTDAAFHREVHGHRVRPSLFSAFKGLFYEWRGDLVYLFSPAASNCGWLARLRAFFVSPFLRAFQLAGQYAGSRGLGGPSAADFEAFERIG